MLVRNLTPRGGPGKLRSYWEDVIYVVKAQKWPSSPVFVVKPLQGTGREQVLHRNLLLPCPYLVEKPNTSGSNTKEKIKKARVKRTKNHTTEQDVQPAETDSSSEGEYYVRTTATQSDSNLNADAEIFHPRLENITEPDEVLEEEIEEIHPEEEEVDSDAADVHDVQSDEGEPGERPRRRKQPRRIYTYDQLGHPTFRVLKSCSTRAKRLSENNV